VIAQQNNQQRELRHLGGGEFVLGLPPLEATIEIEFRGGDDQDGSPFLKLIPGRAPAIVDWNVLVVPPSYTGQSKFGSSQHEFNLSEKSLLKVQFKLAESGTALVKRFNGEIEELLQDSDGVFNFEQIVIGSGECSIQITGDDKFSNQRAAVLSWRAQKDDAPQVAFNYPLGNWLTIPGAIVPVAISASDDFALNSVSLKDFSPVAKELELTPGIKSWETFLHVMAPTPELGANLEDAQKIRFQLSALDNAPPAGQITESNSGWIEIIPEANLRQAHLDRIVRTREQVEGLLEIAEQIAAGKNAAGSGRRLVRRTQRVTFELESILCERLYAGIDDPHRNTIELLDKQLAQGNLSSGLLVEALAAAPPTGRALLLYDLAQAGHRIGTGAGRQTAQLLASGQDAREAAAETANQLGQMLEIMLEWEDFQSAVNLLRDLLERQRLLHLRTREAANN